MGSVAYASPSEAGLSRYLHAARGMPMLTAEDEFRLAHLWRDKLDTAAANKLVTSHLRLVTRIAAGYRGYGLPLSDLISEGNIGMMQAVQRFDPDLGFRFATYAMWWIRAAVQDYVMHSASLVKMGTTSSQKKLFFNLRRIKGQVNAINGDLSSEQASKIAEILDVPVEDVITMNIRMEAPDRSLNTSLHDDGGDQWQDHMPDESESHETALANSEVFEMRKTHLAKALLVLNRRERHILDERWLKDDPATLEQLGYEYGISRERIRQIEMRALLKLRKAMMAAGGGTPVAREGRSLSLSEIVHFCNTREASEAPQATRSEQQVNMLPFSEAHAEPESHAGRRPSLERGAPCHAG